MNAGDAVAIVVEHLTAAGMSIDGRKRAGIGKYAATLIDNGATDDELNRWANHYGERLAEGAHIRPSQAWEDVTGEQGVSPTALAGVPLAKERAKVRRAEGYEHLFDLSEKQEVMLATIQQLTKEGLSTGEIVERILGPREEDV